MQAPGVCRPFVNIYKGLLLSSSEICSFYISHIASIGGGIKKNLLFDLVG